MSSAMYNNTVNIGGDIMDNIIRVITNKKEQIKVSWSLNSTDEPTC